MWVGETAVVIASGPSLTQDQVDFVRGRARVIAINDNYRRALWADVHYFCDPRWYGWHKDEPEWDRFEGFRVTLQTATNVNLGFPTMHNHGRDGLCRLPHGLHTGRNSGHQAVNLAYHFGVARIVLIGFDCKPGPNNETHWFGNHPTETRPSIFRSAFLPQWPKIAADLAEQGVEVINATIDTAITCFPCMTLGEIFDGSTEQDYGDRKGQRRIPSENQR